MATCLYSVVFQNDQYWHAHTALVRRLEELEACCFSFTASADVLAKAVKDRDDCKAALETLFQASWVAV